MSDTDRIAALELDNRRLRESYDHATTGQLTRDDLKRMGPGEIIEAQKSGRLRDIMGTAPDNHRMTDQQFLARKKD